MKKLITVMLTAALALSAAGCGKEKETVSDKTQISVSAWPPQKTQPQMYDQYKGMKEEFEKKNPGVEIIPDSWTFSLETFLAKAASGNLPTIYSVYFTEGKRIIDAGYCADLTKYFKKYGYDEKVSDSIKSMISKDDKYYIIPKSAYTMGLYINKALFEKAGEINEDGTPKIPQTYDELAETAKRIKDKTGKAGICITTANNTGGWQFLNIAWSYGTEFMKQGKDGKWKATFDSDECAQALQFIKDLKWKYDVLPDASFATVPEQQKYFGSDQAAMFIGTPPQDELVTTYNMDPNDICIASLPAGPKGRYAQFGGELTAIKAGSTDAQIDAAIKWLEFSNQGYSLDDSAKKAMEDSYKIRSEKGVPIGFYQYSPWSDNAERIKYEKTIIDKYANIDDINVKEFNNPPADMKFKPEEPVNCQEMYAVLDACIQEVITNKNADPKALLKKAAKDFQKDSLDNAE